MERSLLLHVKVLYLFTSVLSVVTLFQLWVTFRGYPSLHEQVNGGFFFHDINKKVATKKPLDGPTGRNKRATEPDRRPELYEDAIYPGISSSVKLRSKRQTNSDYELCQRILMNCNFQIQGPPGQKGVRGNNGIPGSKGERGDRGYTGVVGSTGATGHKGSKGNDGNPGPIGVRGPEGQKGSTGSRGPIGPQGLKGEKGSPGEQGPKGYQGVLGFPGKKGPAGENGGKGERGLRGPVGYVGPVGPKGERGDVGRNGTQGEKGKRGKHGKRGMAGPPGEIGSPGIQGEPGIKGEKGDPGLQSSNNINCSCPKGEKGDKGLRGLIGFTGYKGDKGEPGRKGDLGHGIRGSDGPKGPPGSKGDKGDKGACDVISSVAMENRMSETNSPYVTRKPDCGDQTTKEMTTTSILTTSTKLTTTSPTTTTIATTTTIPTTTTAKLDLMPRNRDCRIRQVGIPLFQRRAGPNTGAWMKDHSFIWVTNGISGKYLNEFRSLASFRRNIPDQVYDLGFYEYHGYNHVIYNGSFYFHWRNTGTIVCYELKLMNVVAEITIDDAAIGDDIYLYKGSKSHFDIEKDEYGLWIIYANKNDIENTYIIKIDPYRMIGLKKWRLGIRPGTYGNGFIAGGVVYFVKDVRRTVTVIDYAYDLFTNKPVRINTRFRNPFRNNAMVSYVRGSSLRESKIYGWDNGNQIVYQIRFVCS